MKNYIKKLKCLGDKTRIRILKVIIESNIELCVCEIVDSLQIPFYTISKHIKELKNADLGVPISVKTRLGWTSDRDILEFAPKLEEAGADLISIHGRTKKQGYSGEANWERIAEVKKLVSIPVIANGDVKTSEDIERCLEITGADGVMIGRGALGNPWIFCSDIRYQISDSKIKEVVLRHAELHLEQYGEEFGLKTFRKHLVWYFKNKPGIKKLREELVKIETLDDLKRILINY